MRAEAPEDQRTSTSSDLKDLDVSDPTGCGCARACSTLSYCDGCDLLVGLPGLHVTDVQERGGGLLVTVESPPELMGCAGCGLVAVSHGPRVHELIDA